MIWPVYREALAMADARPDGTREDRLSRRIRVPPAAESHEPIQPGEVELGARGFEN
jgi:hypothetical protein